MTERRMPAEIDSNSPPPQVEELRPPWGKEAIEAAYSAIRCYVYARFGAQEGHDVVSKVIEALVQDIDRVRATTWSGFKAWCLGVAHNKVMDAWRSQYRDKLQPMDPADLAELMDAEALAQGLTPGVRSDLHYIFELLYAAKPPCVELLMEHMLHGVEIGVLAARYGIEFDAMRMRVTRCFETAQELARKHI